MHSLDMTSWESTLVALITTRLCVLRQIMREDCRMNLRSFCNRKFLSKLSWKKMRVRYFWNNFGTDHTLLNHYHVSGKSQFILLHIEKSKIQHSCQKWQISPSSFDRLIDFSFVYVLCGRTERGTQYLSD